MMNLTITKDFSYAKAEKAIKAQITADFLEFLSEKYGTAERIRVKSGSNNGTNEIAFIGAIVEEDGETYEAKVTLNPTVKPWKTRPYGKGVRKAFDLEAVVKNYTDWVAEGERKAAENAEKKAKNIAYSEAQRAKKAEAEAKTE